MAASMQRLASLTLARLARGGCRSTAASHLASIRHVTEAAHASESSALLKLKTAAASGSAKSQLDLGLAFVHGTSGAPVSVSEAVRNLYPSACQGDAEAAYWLGHTLRHADAMTKDSAAHTAASEDGEVTPDDLRSQLEAGRQVLKEVRTFRKSARKAKARREAGLPVKPEHAVFDVVGGAQETEVTLTPPPLPKASLAATPAATTMVGGISVTHVGTGADTDTPTSPDTDNSPLETFPPEPLPRASLRQAQYWWQRAAQWGHPDAPVALGNLYLGLKQPPSHSEAGDITPAALALQWYSLAVWGGDTLPTVEAVAATAEALADVPAWGAGEVTDKAAFPPVVPPRRGDGPPLHPDAAYNIGTMLWEGAAGVEANVPLATQHLRLAAVQGDSAALFLLGVHTAEGGGPGATVLRFLESAVQRGHGGAALYLSRLHRNGAPEGSSVPLVEVDVDRARFFLRTAVGLGDPEAVFESADAAYHGHDGQEVDLPAALALYKRAGEAGHGPALYNAGAMTYAGQGAPADATAAFHLYQAAGEAGEVTAWATVAAMYAAGDGVPQNPAAAKYIRDIMEKMGGGV